MISIPVDLSRCQAEKPNGQNFLTFGGSQRLVRCKNTPTVIVTETQPGNDGIKGSMTLCDECLEVAKRQLPKGYFDIAEIAEIQFTAPAPAGAKNN